MDIETRKALAAISINLATLNRAVRVFAEDTTPEKIAYLGVLYDKMNKAIAAINELTPDNTTPDNTDGPLAGFYL